LNERVRRILNDLPFSDASVKDRCLMLLAATEASVSPNEPSLEMMEQRVAEVARKLSKPVEAAPVLAELTDDTPIDSHKNPAPGVRLLGPEEGWRPCPIGFNGITMRR